MLPGTAILVSTDQVSAAQTNYTSSGSYTVAPYNTLTIEGWGAGGGGSSAFSGAPRGTSGGATTVAGSSISTLTANGGSRGTNGSTAGVHGGDGGTASGGDVNTTGGDGVSAPAAGGVPVRGGHAPDGLTTMGGDGDTSTTPAEAPGAGGYGSRAVNYDSWFYAGSGGAGGYFRKVYTYGAVGAPAVGDVLTITVGAGGARASDNQSGAGADGRVEVKVA